MCGILGVRRSFCDDPELFRAAVRAMAWRGPDGVREVAAGDWHLAVARLAITDPARDQPLWSPDRRRVIAFNGAVTSAGEEWRRFGADCATRNDAELPLHRLAAGGTAGLVETRGHYALAILEPDSDRLWLARDPEGEKPLHVVRRGGQVVAFASTVASLRALGLRVRLDPEEQARFFRFGFCLRPALDDPELELESGLHGAWHLGGGDAGELVVAPERRVEPPGGTAKATTTNPAGDPAGDEVADLRARVRGAAARCATAEVPVGLCLSGGVDSACLAAALAGRNLPVYQFRAEGAPAVERDVARRIAGATGHDLRLVDGGPEVLRALPYLTRCAGLPLGDPSVLAVHELARQAAADGVRVLLSGEGADELFLGYRRHRVARRMPRRRLLPWSGGLSMSASSRLLRALGDPQGYDSLLEVVPPAFRDAVLAPDLRRGRLPDAPAASMLHRARHADRTYYLRGDLLPKLDLASMAAGVEGRCPYLDPEVVRSAVALRDDPRGILGKRQLRAAFRADLPAGVLDGRKRGFGLPLDRWLREDDFLADVLSDARTRARPHLDARGLRRMLDLHRSGGAALGHALYLVAAMELHLREVEA